MSSLGERIKQRADELGLSVADLADACGVSQVAVYKWYSGENKNLRLEHLFALAEALNLQPRWLALGDGPKSGAANRDAYRIALSRREAASDERVKSGWERVAMVFAKAAVVVLFLGALVKPELAQATTIGRFDETPTHQRLGGKFNKNNVLLHIASRISAWIVRLCGAVVRNHGFLTAQA